MSKDHPSKQLTDRRNCAGSSSQSVSNGGSVINPVATLSQTAKVGTAANSSTNPGTVSELIRNTSLDISADVSITAGADPAVEATISAQDLGSFQNPVGTAFASMTYYFEVTGPDTAVIIHVKASGSYGGGNAAVISPAIPTKSTRSICLHRQMRRRIRR